uniref:DALR anticodon binding domain containing 3 n=1 Tax=Apteryx owenii TaxID=8824 RepID=A0A8B9QE35_APTOW
MPPGRLRTGQGCCTGGCRGALPGAGGERGPTWLALPCARRLPRGRWFLIPSFPQVPADVMVHVTSLSGPEVLPLGGCQETAAGLAVQVRRPEAFRRLLGACPTPTPLVSSLSSSSPPPSVVLHCPGLRGPTAALAPRHLRPVLLADHLAEVLRAQGVRLVPAPSDEASQEVLRWLRVAWPCGSPGPADAVSSLKRALARSPYATASEWGPGAATLPDGILAKVDLKSFVEQQRLEGYDPNLDVLLVTEEKLQCLVELQQAVLQCVVSNRTAALPGSHFPASIPFCHAPDCCHVVHVVSCEEEFRQQQMDLLWRILDPGAHTKHLVCGPVKVPQQEPPAPSGGFLPRGGGNVGMERAVHVAPLVFSADEAWTEVIDVLTAAAIRFEMLSTAHRSQIVLDLEDSSISTKGTKSGAFVMYNCARLATLFDTYQRAVERGEPQPNGPPPLAATPGLLLMGEWLLLFNYLLPFPEVLQQAAQLPAPSKGIRITASTESVCKFLIQLSMDFSSYYNRVHVLGEPFPHLFDQMFARLQLLAAVRDTFHSALVTLHLPPLSQI